MTKRTIGIGIIGAGFARTTQIPGFQNCEGAKVVAIASARSEHAAEVAREFNIEHVEGDWRKLANRDDVDLVSIVTPPVTHCEMTLAALDAGKAVLCEKPMAMNAAEALLMTERARSAGVLALIDHELRFLSGRIKMRELIHRGDIGPVKHVDLTFRANSRADANRPWNWWSDKTKGGGALGAIASHVVDSWGWAIGAEVTEVLCELTTHVPQREDETGTLRDVTTDDEVNLQVRFGEGKTTQDATGSASISMVDPGKPEHRLEISGALGALRVEERGDLWLKRSSDNEWQLIESEPESLAAGLRPSGWAYGFTAFSKGIVKALQGGRNTVAGAATFEDGYRTQMVLDAARRSDESRRWEKV
jgi:predicted dehydrogenase